MKLLIFILTLAAGLNASGQTINLPKQWKFAASDNEAYAATNYSDNNWQNIEIGKPWEQFIGNNYDSTGWYRTQIIVSSQLKANAIKYGYISLNLGKIDDADITYFNGKEIGRNGEFPPVKKSAWNVDRVYKINVADVNWDALNTIAVRVSDWGGGGGLYAGTYNIEAAGWKQFITTTIIANDSTSKVEEGQRVKLKIVFNNSKDALKGTLVATVTKFEGDTLERYILKPIKIKNGNNKFNINLAKHSKGFYKVVVNFINSDEAQLNLKTAFAVSPTSCVAAADNKTDFDTYWQEAKNTLAGIAPNYTIEPVAKHNLGVKFSVYKISFTSLNNVIVSGYYVTPIGKTNLPALLNVPGYKSEMTASMGLEDAAIFHFNIRGHGTSKEAVPASSFLLQGLEDRQNYFYKGAYMDCIRALDFLCTRKEIDTTKLAIMGISQGGALSFATAALDKRIKATAPDVPFLSDFPNYFKIAFWPGNEFKSFVADKKIPWDKVYETLSYFDIKNLATKISCPIYMGVGLYDNVCPPAINFAAYNNVKSTNKNFVLYPEAEHSLPEKQMTLKINWLLNVLKNNTP
jgi:cephalosporin-C deacetylase